MAISPCQETIGEFIRIMVIGIIASHACASSQCAIYQTCQTCVQATQECGWCPTADNAGFCVEGNWSQPSSQDGCRNTTSAVETPPWAYYTCQCEEYVKLSYCSPGRCDKQYGCMCNRTIIDNTTNTTNTYPEFNNKCSDPCQSISNCQDCTNSVQSGSDKCGWCSKTDGTAGKCVLAQNSKEGDGCTGGKDFSYWGCQCPKGDGQQQGCGSEGKCTSEHGCVCENGGDAANDECNNCSKYKDCGTCLKGPANCGWCNHSGVCMQGNKYGTYPPLNGARTNSCETENWLWNYGTCPLSPAPTPALVPSLPDLLEEMKPLLIVLAVLTILILLWCIYKNFLANTKLNHHGFRNIELTESLLPDLLTSFSNSGTIMSDDAGRGTVEKFNAGLKPSTARSSTGRLSMFGFGLRGRSNTSSKPPRPAWLIDIAKVDLLELIGHGASGQVFRGEMSRTPVAVKKLTLPETDRQAYLDEAMREASTLWDLSHPFIVTFFGLSAAMEDQVASVYLVTELCAVSLDRIYQKPPAESGITSSVFVTLALQVAEGMLYMHSRNIIHRDLKPGNILLTSKDLQHAVPKICDFGMSKLSNEATALMTANLGTPSFMAPELLTDRKSVV